jgi:hypothetical protein
MLVLCGTRGRTIANPDRLSRMSSSFLHRRGRRLQNEKREDARGKQREKKVMEGWWRMGWRYDDDGGIGSPGRGQTARLLSCREVWDSSVRAAWKRNRGGSAGEVARRAVWSGWRLGSSRGVDWPVACRPAPVQHVHASHSTCRWSQASGTGGGTNSSGGKSGRPGMLDDLMGRRRLNCNLRQRRPLARFKPGDSPRTTGSGWQAM